MTTTMRDSLRTSVMTMLAAMLASGCGTKIIDDVESNQMASSDDGGSSSAGAEGPGQTVTSAGADGSSSGGGEAAECEPDPEAMCGPANEALAVALPPPTPVSGPSLPDHTAYDCTITELGRVDGNFSRIILDCGLEFPVDLSTGLPQPTHDKLAVDDAVHVEFFEEWTGNGSVMQLWRDDHLLAIVGVGQTVDPIPGTPAWGPFALEVEGDLCLAPCVEENTCWSWARERVHFVADGIDVAVWGSTSTTVTLDSTDYSIAVLQAQQPVRVNLGAYDCQLQAYPGYGVVIADVTP